MKVGGACLERPTHSTYEVLFEILCFDNQKSTNYRTEEVI